MQYTCAHLLGLLSPSTTSPAAENNTNYSRTEVQDHFP